MLFHSLKASGLVIVFCLSSFVYAGSFVDELKRFEPYIGTWESTFGNKDNPVNDVTRWERALNGTTLRVIHSVNEGAYGGESLMFWDKTQGKLVFYYFTTAGFFTNGHLEWESDTSFVAFEDVTGNKDGITKVKSTSRLEGDVIHVETSYLKKGEWTQPESRTYRRSNKKVIFK